MKPIRLDLLRPRHLSAGFEVSESELIFETVQRYRSKNFEMYMTKGNTLEYIMVCLPSVWQKTPILRPIWPQAGENPRARRQQFKRCDEIDWKSAKNAEVRRFRPRPILRGAGFSIINQQGDRLSSAPAGHQPSKSHWWWSGNLV